MSATRKPAPSETASEILKFIRAHHLEMKHEGFLDHCELCLPAYLEISTLFQCITDLRAESGAPLQPGATQPEHEGVGNETAPMTAAHIPLGGSVEHRLYSKAELTTLLERMARLVVQEAAQLVEHCNREGPYQAIGAAPRIRDLLTPEKLQQLREAVERP